MLNIVFMGTPDFAVPALQALAADCEGRFAVRAVYTRPDAASGRGKALLPSPVRACAEQLGIAVRTPRSFWSCAKDGRPALDAHSQRVADAALLAEAAAFEPDFLVVAAYGVVLPPALLELPRCCAVNIHASLLPRWRGAAPIQRAILAGDAQAGVSLMRMQSGLDTGPYCATAAVPVGDKDAAQLTAELALAGAGLLIKGLPQIAAGTVRWQPQDETLATYADKLAKEELLLSPELSAHANLRRVRASSAQTPARCRISGRTVTVLKAQEAGDLEWEAPVPGQVAVAGKELYLACAPSGDVSKAAAAGVASSAPTDAAGEAVPFTLLHILELKPEGKGAMSGKAFVAGNQELRRCGAQGGAWCAIL